MRQGWCYTGLQCNTGRLVESPFTRTRSFVPPVQKKWLNFQQTSRSCGALKEHRKSERDIESNKKNSAPRFISTRTYRKIIYSSISMAQIKKIFPAIAIMLLISLVSVEANPIGVCIRNCAQCKKMFGPYFEGQLCADACVKYKGKFIPDCEEISSIAPFLIKFDLNLQGDEDGKF